MSKKHFYDPHPGFAGAAIRFPLKAVADDLDGKEVTVEEAISLFKSAYENNPQLKSAFYKCEVEESPQKDYIYIVLHEGSGGNYPSHSFRAIRYKD